MSNQRPALLKPASLSGAERGSDTVSLMKLRRFFTDAEETLRQRGDEDSAYYFEVVGDYFKEDFKGGDIDLHKALAL